MSETRSEKLDPRVERLLALILEARKARLASGAPWAGKAAGDVAPVKATGGRKIGYA